MPANVQARQRVTFSAEHIAGSLAYFTFIAAGIFLWLAPYNRNRFVRYHSFQCLLFWAAMLVAAAVLRLVALVVLMIPVMGAPLVFLAWVIAGLAAFLLWLVLVIKALQGEIFKLPVLGELAERCAVTP